MYGAIKESEVLGRVDSRSGDISPAKLGSILTFAAASMYGCWIRVLLVKLGSNPFQGFWTHGSSSSMTGLYVANFLGSFLLGLFAVDSSEEVGQAQVMIGTAFSGSLTSFSSCILNLNREVSSSQDKISYAVFETIATLVTSFAGPIVGFALGYYHRNMRKPVIELRPDVTVIVSAVMIACAILLSKDYKFILLASISGAALRWAFVRAFNNQKHFPLGTFSANVISCIVAIFVSNVVDDGDVERLLVVGFCSALSTMSGFAAELVMMDRIDAYKYFFCSIALSWVVVAIMDAALD